MKAAATKPSESTVPTAHSPADHPADAILAKGRDVLRKEADAIGAASQRLGEPFCAAVDMLLNCRGRVAVTGMGKAGLIGDKIQATMSSTGTPSYFLHPVEAIHGDVGMVRPDDVVIALSRSGETQELLQLFPVLRRIGCRIALITAKPRSKGAGMVDAVIDIGDTPEACPLGLAPSSSTAAMLAVGDALALTAMELRQFAPEDYAVFHPGGALGRSLMKAGEIMRTGADCPRVSVDGLLSDYEIAIDAAPRRAGGAAIVDAAGKLLGIFTHGDLFRLLRDHSADPMNTPIAKVMTSPCKSVRADDRAATALSIMRKHRIDELPVVDDAGLLTGLIDIQDLIACGFSAIDDA